MFDFDFDFSFIFYLFLILAVEFIYLFLECLKSIPGVQIETFVNHFRFKWFGCVFYLIL